MIVGADVAVEAVVRLTVAAVLTPIGVPPPVVPGVTRVTFAAAVGVGVGALVTVAVVSGPTWSAGVTVGAGAAVVVAAVVRVTVDWTGAMLGAGAVVAVPGVVSRTVGADVTVIAGLAEVVAVVGIVTDAKVVVVPALPNVPGCKIVPTPGRPERTISAISGVRDGARVGYDQ